MTRVRKYWVPAAAAGALLFGIALSCQHDPPIQTLVPSEGVATDVVEAESEPLSGAPSAARNTSGDTLIASRKTPALPQPIDVMTNAEVVGYLNLLRYKTGGYNTHSANVPCVHGSGGSACTGTDSAHVFIQPEAGMNKWARDSIPTNGLIVARIINDSPVDRDAAVFYYPAQHKTWWVVDRTTTGIRSRFFVRTYSSTGPAIRFVGSTWPFVRCSHGDAPPWRAARAKFWTCLESAVDTTGVSRAREDASPVGAAPLESYIHPVSLRSAIPLPPAPPQESLLLESNWVTCGSGCCATN